MIKSETLKGTLCGKLIELLSYIAEKLNAGQKQGDQIYNNFECRFNWEVIE